MLPYFGPYLYLHWWSGPCLDSSLLATFKSKSIYTNLKASCNKLSHIIRNADKWIEEQRRRLRWLRAKSIELGIYRPEDKDDVNGANGPSNASSNSSTPPGKTASSPKTKKRRVKAE